MKSTKVFIAEDHTSSREEFVQMIEKNKKFKVIGQAENGADALQGVLETNPDIVVLDISMPGKSGFEVMRALKEENNTVKCVLLTFYSDPEIIDEAIELDTCGYILKDSVSEHLEDALDTISRGGRFFSPELNNK